MYLYLVMFQLGVQAHASVTKCCINKKDGSIFSNLGGCFDSDDGKWVLNAIISAGNVSQFSNLQKRDLRIPQTLIQTEFLKRLQSGVAISCLFRLSFLSRFNKIFDEAIAEIFAGDIFFLFLFCFDGKYSYIQFVFLSFSKALDRKSLVNEGVSLAKSPILILT